MLELQTPVNKVCFEQATFHDINNIVPNDEILCYLCVSEWMHIVLRTLQPSLQQVFTLRHKLCFRLSLMKKQENISL
jgi:hypothetical protein